ncbi:MAG: threonine/serine dehydratase [Saprospiraceae bacterium]
MITLSLVHEEVIKAYDQILGFVHHTALVYSHPLSDLIDGKVYLKCENEQYTGSFKARGSLNKMISLTDQERKIGVVTASTGNHALGFSRALTLTNTKGTVYLPTNASTAKIQALSYYSAELVRYGDNSLSTELHAKEMAKQAGLTWMSPYNDLNIIAGQGTIAVEIFQEIEDLDCILVTVGGGGLISGIGGYAKVACPSIRMVGCQPRNSPEMTLSLEAGHIVDLPKNIDTLSDGSAGGIEPNAVTFGLCQEIIDESILVTEQEIKHAIRFVFNHHKKVIEGAAAVAVASLINNVEKFKNKSVVIVLCGSNIDSEKFINILKEK